MKTNDIKISDFIHILQYIEHLQLLRAIIDKNKTRRKNYE